MKLQIEKAIYGGAGLARNEGKAIFVPFTLPGEVVETHVTEDRGSYANAELDAVLESSPERVAPPCAYFGECGGCHYQHARYEAQVEMKVQILRESLERAHLSDIPPIFAVQGEALGYRNRIRLHVGRASSMLCYKRRGSHANLAVKECPIAAPVLQEALAAVQERAKDWRLSECFSEVEFFTDADQRAVLITLLSGRSKGEASGDLERLWPQFVGAIPQIKGAAVLSSSGGKAQGAMLAQAGQQALTYRAADEEYRVSLGSFFQVNRLLIDPLVELVIMDRTGEVAWDLYAGVGLFARALAARFKRVVAVEAAASSVRDLSENLGGGAHRVAAASTLEFLRRARSDGQRKPDFVVVDPPRAGLGKEITALLAEIRPAHITYVSCDPTTLSRDLKSLLDSGYQLTKLHMVDLFPQTFHLESVAMLSL
jgi:23S rRNA (uracil1939-C5)-methyltransferase